MNVGQVIQKVKDLIAAAKAGNYLIAVGLLLEIVKAITDTMSPASFGQPRPLHATVDVTTMDEYDLINELDKCCQQPMNAQATSAAPKGPIIDAVLPILLALLKKWLGF